MYTSELQFQKRTWRSWIHHYHRFTEYFIHREHELEFRFEGSLHTLYCVCHHAYEQVKLFSSFDRHLPLGSGNNNCTKICGSFILGGSRFTIIQPFLVTLMQNNMKLFLHSLMNILWTLIHLEGQPDLWTQIFGILKKLEALRFNLTYHLSNCLILPFFNSNNKQVIFRLISTSKYQQIL